MTKVMSLTAVMALLAQGGAPNPKIPIPQRPLQGHVVISLVKPSVLEQHVCFTTVPDPLAHEADPTTSASWDPPWGTQKAEPCFGIIFEPFWWQQGSQNELQDQ